MEKYDFKKAFKHLFSASASKPAIIEVPECAYLIVDGECAPDGNPQFEQAMQTFYGVMYTLKMGWKFEKIERPHGYVDFSVPPPEALWWMSDGCEFDMNRPADWRWTQLMMTPDFFTPNMVEAAAAVLREKKARRPLLLTASNVGRRALACKCFTWGLITPKEQPSKKCAASPLKTAGNCTENTTKFTSTTHAAQHQKR